MSTENKVHSFKVAATLTSQRGVYLNGTANTVAYPDTTTSLPVGITIDDVTDTNQGIAVAHVGAIAKLYFNDTVTSGALVSLDTSGRGVPYTAGSTTTDQAYVGVLVDATIAATGTIANVLIQPGIGG